MSFRTISCACHSKRNEEFFQISRFARNDKDEKMDYGHAGRDLIDLNSLIFLKEI